MRKKLAKFEHWGWSLAHIAVVVFIGLELALILIQQVNTQLKPLILMCANYPPSPNPNTNTIYYPKGIPTTYIWDNATQQCIPLAFT